MKESYKDIPVWATTPARNPSVETQVRIYEDRGPEPFVVNIEDLTERNRNFRTAIWTGTHMQLTVMSIEPGDDIGLEKHTGIDQFIRIEEGEGVVLMGENSNDLTFRRRVEDDYAIIIPAGKWHNVINTGTKPLKLYSLYAPPEHPKGTLHVRKEDEAGS
jgi:mannose-6-phosphate isomerase-like protein (cupin superfamily)